MNLSHNISILLKRSDGQSHLPRTHPFRCPISAKVAKVRRANDNNRRTCEHPSSRLIEVRTVNHINNRLMKMSSPIQISAHPRHIFASRISLPSRRLSRPCAVMNTSSEIQSPPSKGNETVVTEVGYSQVISKVSGNIESSNPKSSCFVISWYGEDKFVLNWGQNLTGCIKLPPWMLTLSPDTRTSFHDVFN